MKIKILLLLIISSIFCTQVYAQSPYSFKDPSTSIQNTADLEQAAMSAQERLMNNPQAMMELQDLVKDPEIARLLADPELMRIVTSNDVNAITSNPQAQALINNPKMRAFVEKMRDSTSNNNLN